MAKDRMDVLGLLRKEASEADPDFPRAGLRVLIQAVMEAEVDNKTGAGLGERPGADQLARRLPGSSVGYAGGHAETENPKGTGGQLLPLSVRTAPAQRASLARRRAAGLRGGRLLPPRRGT